MARGPEAQPPGAMLRSGAGQERRNGAGARPGTTANLRAAMIGQGS